MLETHARNRKLSVHHWMKKLSFWHKVWRLLCLTNKHLNCGDPKGLKGGSRLATRKRLNTRKADWQLEKVQMGQSYYLFVKLGWCLTSPYTSFKYVPYEWNSFVRLHIHIFIPTKNFKEIFFYNLGFFIVSSIILNFYNFLILSWNGTRIS
jgi:hypothetical protein